MAGRALRIGSLVVLWMAWNAPVRAADLPAFQEAAAAAQQVEAAPGLDAATKAEVRADFQRVTADIGRRRSECDDAHRAQQAARDRLTRAQQSFGQRRGELRGRRPRWASFKPTGFEAEKARMAAMVQAHNASKPNPRNHAAVAAYNAAAQRGNAEVSAFNARVRAARQAARTRYRSARQAHRAEIGRLRADLRAFSASMMPELKTTAERVVTCQRARQAAIEGACRQFQARARAALMKKGLAYRQLVEVSRGKIKEMFDGERPKGGAPPAAGSVVDTRGVRPWAPGERERQLQLPGVQRPSVHATREPPSPPSATTTSRMRPPPAPPSRSPAELEAERRQRTVLAARLDSVRASAQRAAEAAKGSITSAAKGVRDTAGQAGRAVAERARALLAAVRALEEPRGPPAATADPAKPGTHGAAKAAHTVVDALRALEPAALRKPKALGSAVGKGLAAQKADAPASDLGQAIGAALKALGKGWRRAGDLAKAVSQAVVAFGGKLATNAADGARAAGAALRETAPAALATAKGAAKIVAQTLRPASSAWRHRAEDVGVAVGAALAETRQKWLTDGVGVGTAVGGALKGVRAPALRAVAARAKAVGVAVAEAGDSLFANAASAGAAVGAALKVVLGRGRSRGAQLAEATGIAIAELSTRAAIKARGVLESAREVGEALGGALRLGLGAAAKSPRVFERALVGAIASFKKAQPGPVADSKVTLLVAGLRTWRPGDRGAVLTSFANTANLLLGQHDNERDGAVRRHPYRGPGRKEARWDLSYGNGVLNTPEDRTRNRGALQKLAHQDVTQIVNRTDGVRDLVSCIREVNAGKRSPPSDAIADLVVQHVREARPMKHVAHSENTLQTALGLERARRLLIAGAGGATPMSAGEAEVAIRRWVRVAGVGPAIGRHHTLIEGLLNLVFAKTAGKVERAVLDVSGAKDDSFTLQLEIPTWFAGNDPAGRAYWQNFAHPEDPISMAVGEGGLGKVDLAHHDFQEYANPSTPLGHALGRWVDTDHWTERAPVSPASP